MMKIKFIITFLGILNSQILLSQNRFHLVIDYVKTTAISEEVKKVMPQVTELQPALFQYRYADGKSSFRFVKGIGESKMKAFANYNIFKDLEKRMKYISLVKDSTSVTQDTLICENWELHPNEVKEIEGYSCHKATSENGMVAWYCEDIPVADGPFESTCDLPGMILSVFHGGTTIEAVTVTISEKGAPVQLPIVEKYLPKKEFIKRRGH